MVAASCYDRAMHMPGNEEHYYTMYYACVLLEYADTTITAPIKLLKGYSLPAEILKNLQKLRQDAKKRSKLPKEYEDMNKRRYLIIMLGETLMTKVHGHHKWCMANPNLK